MKEPARDVFTLRLSAQERKKLIALSKRESRTPSGMLRVLIDRAWRKKAA